MSFSKLSTIFENVERDKEVIKSRKEKGKPRSDTFKAVHRALFTKEPKATKSTKEESTPRSSTSMESAQPKKSHNLGRQASDPFCHTLKAAQSRARLRSAPARLMIDRAKLLNDSRLTEAAKQLSDEELALLYEDVLKPLDFYAVLHTL